MKAFLHHLAEITRCREHDQLDLAAITALQRLTRAVSVAMLDVSQTDNSLFVQVKAVAEQDAVRTYFDGMPDTAPESRLVPCPQPLADGIQRYASKVEAHDENGLYLMWLPVWLNDRIHCCIRLSCKSHCDAETRLTIEGIVTVYANHQDLLDYSERDSLTGLLNRKTFDACFARMTAQCVLQRQTALPGQPERRHSEPARENWLAVVDIDHFKRINDRFGHAVGDKALKHVCLIAQQALRPTDMLGRFGGDEFVALLPGNDHAAALVIAERIRAHVHESKLEGAHTITASFGIAAMRDHDTYETIFERADQALYKAKQEGRNRTAWLAA